MSSPRDWAHPFLIVLFSRSDPTEAVSRVHNDGAHLLHEEFFVVGSHNCPRAARSGRQGYAKAAELLSLWDEVFCGTHDALKIP
jgi:hypothetical protein